MRFKSALLAAAKQACSQGMLPKRDYLRLWVVCTLPLPRFGEILAQCEAMAKDAAIEMGVVASDATEIDWQQLIDLLMEVLPAIIQLILILIG